MRDKLLCIILLNMTLLSDQEMKEAFSRWKKQNPKPASELDYINPFTLLVAVVLSAQTTDKGVNKATGPLFKIADTPEKMLALGEEKLISYIKTIGLYKNKAKHVMGLSQKLSEMSEDEQLSLLSSDGMLVKRPLAVGDGFVMTGFNDEEWSAKLK